jgi:hypothetical protein
MVSAAYGGTIGPDPSYNYCFVGLSSAHLRRIASRSPSATQAGMSAAVSHRIFG